MVNLSLIDQVLIGVVFTILIYGTNFFYYPPVVERTIASLYDTRDMVFDLANEQIPFPKVNLGIVNRGGHFQSILDKALKRDSDGGTFFEGWYYKLVSEDEHNTVIVIPGVLFDGNNTDDYGFILVGYIQRDSSGKVIDHSTSLNKFSLNEVAIENFDDDKYKFVLGKNIFTENSLSLSIPGVASGDVKLNDILEYPGDLFNPTIMGVFSYLDMIVGMECVHKLIALDSKLDGKINLTNDNKEKSFDFNKGKGYVEGDYGTSFPNQWIWIASNHFSTNPGSSFLFSMGSVPFPNSKQEVFRFPGFLGFIYDAKLKKTYRFGTYTGASLSIPGLKEGLLKDKEEVEITIKDTQYEIKITAKGDRENGSFLWAPVPHPQTGFLEMKRFIKEMLDAEIQITIIRRSDGQIVFDDHGKNGGLEIEF